MATEKNWAGNLTYSASELYHPESVEEVRELVRSSNKLRALGSRHSFNSIADTDGALISLSLLNRILELDTSRRTVTFEAGIKYGDLCAPLEHAGLALHNLASLPHISVAGACATATHGSGIGNGDLASAVSAMQLVSADGSLVECSRERDGTKFYGMVVGLGALGIVTRLTVDLVPSFQVSQTVYENLSLAQLQSDFQSIVSGGYSVSLFTDWQSPSFNQVWVKRRPDDDSRTPAPDTFFGATSAPMDRHPIGALSPINCTAQMGLPGPWYERLPHFRMDFTPSSGEELQSEYFVPQRYSVAAISAISQLSEQIAPHLLISEIRTIAADSFWLSPCYKQPCTALHFTWKNDWENVRRVLPGIESVLAPFEARPHWGKLFTMTPAHLQSLYPKLIDFRTLAGSFDPTGKFRNAFLDTNLFSS